MLNLFSSKCHPAIRAVWIVTFFYAIFAFWGLGDVEFWGDEGLMALGSNRVLHHGYPKAWDGQNLFSLEAGHDLSEGLLQKRMPWLGFYIGALGQLFFGETNFGARFGFTLCGVLNLPLLYFVGRLIGLSRRISFLSMLILASLAGYFLYIRQSYHYAPDVTFSLLGLACYLRIERRWSPMGRSPWHLASPHDQKAVTPCGGGWSPILLSLCVVALFHLSYLSAMWLAISLTLWSVWDGKFISLFKRPSVWAAFFIALIGTYGWIRWASVVEFQDSLGGWSTLLPDLSRLGFVLSELDMSFPLLFTIPAMIWCGYRSKQDEALRRLFRLSICAIGTFLFFGGFKFAWLRFFLFIFAVFSWIWAALLMDLFLRKRNIGVGIAIFMFATTLPYHVSHRILGWIINDLAFIAHRPMTQNENPFLRYSMQRFPSVAGTPSILEFILHGINPILIEVPSELAACPVTSYGEIIPWLNRHAKPGEKIVSLCDSEIIQFRTKLITVYLVDPRQESYRKVKHLPSYVTSYQEADWILLRNYWKRNYGMKELNDTDQNAEILEYYRKTGATLESIPLKVREHFPNQLPMLWGHIWTTDIGKPTMQLYRVHRNNTFEH